MPGMLNGWRIESNSKASPFSSCVWTGKSPSTHRFCWCVAGQRVAEGINPYSLNVLRKTTPPNVAMLQIITKHLNIVISGSLHSSLYRFLTIFFWPVVYYLYYPRICEKAFFFYVSIMSVKHIHRKVLFSTFCGKQRTGDPIWLWMGWQDGGGWLPFINMK